MQSEMEKNREIRVHSSNRAAKKGDAVTSAVNLFKYLNYRDYLKDFYQYKKSQNPHFSYASFAIKAKINTPNYLKRVIDGERSLNAESIPKFCFGLELSPKESIYFEALVNFNQSKDEDIKRHYWGIMRKASEDVPGAVLEVLGQQFEAFSHWYILPVRELVLLQDFHESPANIVKLMKNKITKKEAEHALETLFKLNMLKRDESGRLCQTQPIVRYSQEVINLSIREFHRQMLNRAHEALNEDEFGTWNARALSLAIKNEDFQEIYQKISDFIFGLNKEYSFEDGGSTSSGNDAAATSAARSKKDLVVQINCQMLQLSGTDSIVKYEKPKRRGS